MHSHVGVRRLATEIHVNVENARGPVAAPCLATSKSFFPGSTKKGQFQPLPVAINILKSNLAKPSQLCFDADELVRMVLIRLSDAERAQKSCVQFGSPRCHMFQIAEHAAGR